MRTLLLALLLVAAPAVLSAQSIDRDRDRDWRDRRYAVNDDVFELTPFGGFRWGGTLFSDPNSLFDEDLDVASDASYGVNFGIPLGISRSKLELMVNRQDTALQLGGGLFEPDNHVADFHITYYHAGLMVPLTGDPSSPSPFVVVSAGVANLKPDIPGVSADNRFSASIGGGVKVPLNRNVGIRVEGRGYFTSLGNEERCNRCRDDYGRDLYQGEASVGLVISF